MRTRSCHAIVALLLMTTPAIAFAQDQDVRANADPNADAADAPERTMDAGPLRDRVVPVSGNLFSKKGRFELSPSASVTIRDAFFTKYIFGGTLTYHITETWAVSLRGGYSVPIVSGAAQICTTETTSAGAVPGCRNPRFSELNGKAPGQITMLSGADVLWEPIYGKLALWSELFVHFDLYVVGGPALIEYQGPTSNGAAGSQTYFTAGGNIGLGTRVFLNKWLALRGELRDVLYVEKVSAGSGNSFRNQILFELGLSFFFPTSSGS
jgi:outer membrane beta-barrel protein